MQSSDDIRSNDGEPGTVNDDRLELLSREIRSNDIEPGTVVDGRFEILSLIGQGGMCMVYRARHVQLQKNVAFKMLHDRLACDADSVKRFQREALAVAELKHPGIVEVYGFGSWQDKPYMVMELLLGESLAETIKREGKLSEDKVFELGVRICDALEYAHERRIVHRDLKPSNVMLSSDGTPKLVDFGLAKLLPDSGKQVQKLTQTGQVFGTVLYMSPEQCLGQPLDGRSDLYSLGCLLYEAAAGVPPFDDDAPYVVLGKHLGEMPDPIPGVSETLNSLIMWAMAKSPEARPANAAELKHSLIDRVTRQSSPRTESPKKIDRTLDKKLLIAACSAIILVLAAAAGLLIMVREGTPLAPSRKSLSVADLADYGVAVENGDIAIEREDFETAQTEYARAMQIAVKFREKRRSAEATYKLCDAHFAHAGVLMGNKKAADLYAAAVLDAESALKQSDQLTEEQIVHCKYVLAYSHLMTKDARLAIGEFRWLIDHYIQKKDMKLAMNSQLCLARTYNKIGDYEAAFRAAQEARVSGEQNASEGTVAYALKDAIAARHSSFILTKKPKYRQEAIALSKTLLSMEGPFWPENDRHLFEEARRNLAEWEPK